MDENGGGERNMFGLHEMLLSAMRHSKFCAAIEITNGTYHRRKKRQKSAAMGFLKKLSSRSVPDIKLRYGLAIMSSSNDRLKKLYPSFRINVPYLDQTKYRRAAIHALDSQILASSEKEVLEKILEQSELDGISVYHSLKHSKLETGGIIGGLLEIYLRDLFEESMGGKSWARFFSRFPYSAGGNICDIDLLVVCSSSEFRDALDNLEKLNSKLRVTYEL